MICEPLEHEWEVEEVSGNKDIYKGIVMKLRCSKCNASLKGEINT